MTDLLAIDNRSRAHRDADRLIRQHDHIVEGIRLALGAGAKAVHLGTALDCLDGVRAALDGLGLDVNAVVGPHPWPDVTPIGWDGID